MSMVSEIQDIRQMILLWQLRTLGSQNWQPTWILRGEERKQLTYHLHPRFFFEQHSKPRRTQPLDIYYINQFLLHPL